MADYGPGDDPIHANYLTTNQVAIGGLIGLAGFAAIGIGAFFTTAAAEAGTALDIGFTVAPGMSPSGLAGYMTGTALSEGQVIILAEMEAVAINTEMGGGVLAALTACAESWGMETFSVEALIALAAYNEASAYGPNFFNLGAGGYGVPHTFPGVGFLPAGPPGSYWACVGVGVGDRECTLYF